MDMDLVKTLRKQRRYGINPVLIIALAAMALLSLSRIMLSIWKWEYIPDGKFLTVLIQGLRVDFASVCGLFALPALVLLLVSMIPYLRMPRLILVLVNLYCSAAIAFLILNEAATPQFMTEFGVRPNYIYVQYLLYWEELLLILWSGHKIKLFLTIVFVAASMYASFKLSARLFRGYHQGAFRYNYITLVIVLCTVPLGIRSSFGHSPFNPSMVAFCSNPLANNLPLNSSYSAVYDAFHFGELTVGSDSTYQIMTDAEAFEGVLLLSKRKQDPDTNRLACRINQFITPFDGVYVGRNQDGVLNEVDNEAIAAAGKSPRSKPYNVVIVVEESLGDNFLKSQGGEDVARNFEALKEKGWWFENMYATGHRTTRGIEAITTAFTPSSLLSIVQLDQPARPYATLAEIFRAYGYDTSFIYGGNSHLYKMNKFFSRNGTDVVVDEGDFKDPSYEGTWGVSDEDLFAKANEYFKDRYARGEKFYSLVLTNSLRDPYDIPDDKVSLDDAVKTENEDRYLAAKYADYALGKFMDQAAQEDYYKDTIFLVISNHESSVRVGMVFPVDDFTVPAVIIAPNVMPHVDVRQVSQIDMPMTLLALNGMEGSIPNVGQDLTQAKIKQRGIMQLNNTFALIRGNRMIELSANAAPTYYMVERKGGHEIVTKDTRLSSEDDEEAKTLLYDATRMNNIGPFMYRSGSMSTNCLRLKNLPEASTPKTQENQSSTQAPTTTESAAASS